MKSSLLWALVTSISAAALIACTTSNQFILPGSGGGNEGGDGSGNATTDGGNTSDGAGSPGGSSGAVNPQGQAHQYFVSTVFPSLNSTCTSCHGNPANTAGAPQFLAATAEAAYTAVDAYTPALIAVPENSLLIQHGVHTGPALDPGQVTLVSEWLQMEADERGLVGGGDTPPTGPTLQEALQGFADCMNYDTWMADGLDNLAMTQTQYGACYSCHSSGDAANWLSLNGQETFDMNRQFPYIKRLVSGTVDETGAFAGLVPARRWENKGLEAESCNPDLDNCHPVYSLQGGMVTGIDDFVDATIQLYEAGGCTPQP